MRDYLGNELSVGDEVIFIQLGYRNFRTGIIEKITKKMVFIKFGDRDYDILKQWPDQIIKMVKNTNHTPCPYCHDRILNPV